MTGHARGVPPLADPSVRRIAIVRLRVGLGDLLASVPALRALRARRPDATVTMITWPETAPILARQAAYVDELLAFPGHPGIPERPPDRSAWPAFLAEARSREFDLALQMYGWQPAANAVAGAIAARLHGGFVAEGTRPPDPVLHLPYPAGSPEVHRHLDLVRHLGVAGGDDAFEFPLTAADHTAAAELRRAHGLSVGRYACVHAGATAPSRRWPPERFARVADALVDRGLPVVLTGVAGEERTAGAVAAAMRHPASCVVGRTGLGVFAALLGGSAVLVGNDSGPAHLAHALSVPSVTIFMAGELERWAAFDRRRHAALQAAVACQPCPHQECPIDLRCADIAPHVVVDAADAVLAHAAAKDLP